MAVIIKAVTISPNTLEVGKPFVVQVRAEEATWNNVKTELQTWGEVRRSFTNWNRVKDFIYNIPTPAPDVNCVYDVDGNALFDVDAVQISISGGATLRHSAATVDYFLGEVLNG